MEIYNSHGSIITTGQEIATSEFIDGKQVFRKRINCGALPNTTTKTISHGLSNATFVKIEGIVYEGGYSYPIPYVAIGQLGETNVNSVGITVTSTAIILSTNRSVNATAIIDLYYTKNS